MYRFTIACLLAVALPHLSSAQSIHSAFDGVARVSNAKGSGTGFVVAASKDRFEVWTNAHVAGSAGDSVTVTFGWKTRLEKSYSGKVIWSAYDSTRDAAKCIVKAIYDGPVFDVAGVESGNRIFATAGHPLGGRAYGLTLAESERHSFGSVEAYLPASIPGQSGSPVVDERGSVVGVVTLRLGIGKNAVGGMLPINHWTGEKPQRVSTQLGWGKFNLLPLAPK